MEMVFKGVLAVAMTWALVGLLILCFTPVFIQRGAPASAKMRMVFGSMLRLPAFYILHGFSPAIVIKQDDAPPEEQERFSQWLGRFCDCDDCKRERGE